ncbi:AbiH family protein [Ekhidna sp.]|uniref:AbiH family protein n=1 Tax=Ekhidna sp. TaxID=2608089 RepID=UPI003B5B4911
MNSTQLIIIGNGFDLAHGLPTRYSDFLNYYISEIVQEVIESRKTYKDPLIKVSHPVKPIANNERNDFRAIISSRINSSPFGGSSSIFINEKGFLHFILQKRGIERWQNLELLYHDFLIDILDQLKRRKTNLEKARARLVYFNQSIEFFLSKFRNYIIDVVNPLIKTISPIDKFYKIFGYKENQFLTVLNFNYTRTFEKYIDDEGTAIINIHGQADTKESEICFGFGDEHSPRYNEIENLYENEFLKYSKSIFYSKDETYRHLLGCLSGNYTVDIYGHSCGVTDRTLLKQIFEDKKCSSIHYHYHLDHKDHREKFIEINRHFEDKKRLRRIVVPAESSTPCPQLK